MTFDALGMEEVMSTTHARKLCSRRPSDEGIKTDGADVIVDLRFRDGVFRWRREGSWLWESRREKSGEDVASRKGNRRYVCWRLGSPIDNLLLDDRRLLTEIDHEVSHSGEIPILRCLSPNECPVACVSIPINLDK